jgi:hypothetical protein
MLFAPISSTKTNRWGFTLSETITLQATLSHSSRYHRPHRSPFFWLKPIWNYLGLVALRCFWCSAVPTCTLDPAESSSCPEHALT